MMPQRHADFLQYVMTMISFLLWRLVFGVWGSSALL